MIHPLVCYFVLVYALIWCAYVPLALQGQGLLSGVSSRLHLAAFIVTVWTGDGAGLRELLGRLTR